ncbi:MAG: GNAT family N-acetyltransferase [Planctomycetia bacterium]|nr:GNAT family N-acetyltransferase [Planctomycetia bacterium]
MSLTITPPDLKADRECILALWRRNLPEAAATRFDWLYETGRAASWIVRDEKGEAMGSIGLMARAMKVFDQSQPAGQPIDLNVDRRHRLGGIAVRLQRTVTAEVEQGRLGLIYGFPNAQSEPVLRRVGYRSLAQVGRWAKPLTTDEVLEKWLRRRSARKVAATALDAALRLVSPETFYRRPKNLRVEVTDRFDERFDRLWEVGRERFGIVGQRTADYLRWRFAECPGARYRTFCLSDADDRLLGYLVYSRRDGVAYLADFFFAEPAHFDVLLSEFIRVMRQDHAKAIVTIYTGAASVAGRLVHFGFRRRASSWTAMVHAPAADEQFWDEENWFLTRADIDTDF